jgi:hypothetical protein
MSAEDLRAENAELRRRLAESEETLHAIRTGAVDAFVIADEEGTRVYTLKTADRPYRLFVEHMQQGAATLQRDGTLVYSNARLAEVLGAPQETLAGTRLASFVVEEDRDLLAQLLEVGAVAPTGGELRFACPSGGTLPVYLDLSPLTEDCGASVGLLVTDLRSRRSHEQLAAAHQALHKSEERHRSLVSMITDVLWTADSTGRFVTEQPAWSAYTGQSWDDLRDLGWLDAVHREDRDAVRAAWRRVGTEGEAYESRFRLWHRASGRWRRCLARAVPLRDASGAVREWVGACTDVEEREALLASERQARAEANRAARLKDEFLAIVSHELRSPLNAIVGYTHLLKRSGGDARHVAEAIEVIERNTKLQAQLIDDLLDMSRITAGKLRLQGKRLALRRVVDEALDAVRPLAEAKGIQILVDDRAEGEHVHGDGGRLQQIAWNLLSNAIKFTARDGRVEVALCRCNGEFELRVTDTGEGIEPEFLPYVFDRFRQADSSSARKHGGLGLGLSLVKQLAELHGGSVEARSDGKGKGAVFIVRLPSAEAGSDAGPGARDAETVDLAGINVLVVDDEPDGLEVSKRILEECGADVIEATGADEGLAHLATRQVDVILSDIGMPQRDGYEFIRAVRQQNVTTPAAAVTAFAGAQDVERAFREGYQAHIAKPVLPAHLVRTVALLCGRAARVDTFSL